MMHGNLFHATLQIEVLVFKVFNNSYGPVAHSDSFIINIAIVDMHRLTATIFYVSNTFQNEMFPFMKDYVSVHHHII